MISTTNNLELWTSPSGDWTTTSS